MYSFCFIFVQLKYHTDHCETSAKCGDISRTETYHGVNRGAATQLSKHIAPHCVVLYQLKDEADFSPADFPVCTRACSSRQVLICLCMCVVKEKKRKETRSQSQSLYSKMKPKMKRKKKQTSQPVLGLLNFLLFNC